MALLGWYVYAYLTHETMIIDLFGIPIPPLSIALLVVIPVFVLYLVSVLHMWFYNMLRNYKQRRTEKDYEKLFDSIVDAYLGKIDRKHNLKTPGFAFFGELLDNSTVFLNKNIDLDFDDEKSKKISNVLKAIEGIKNSEVVDLKAYSLSVNNQLVVQNHRNMYKSGKLSGEDILSHASKYNEGLCREVYADFVKTATVGNIDKYKHFLTKEALTTILARVNAQENTLEISNEALQILFANLELNVKEYIEMSRTTSASMIPEQRIKLFETLSNKNEEAVEAYLYTLLDLEMLAPAYEILDISQPSEYQKFKAYRALKDANQYFGLELFI
jgi:hypothetical protein